MRAPLTVGDLVEALARDEVSADHEVRLVFHGKTRRSFNLPALEAREGVNRDLIIVCFEEFADDEAPVPDVEADPRHHARYDQIPPPRR